MENADEFQQCARRLKAVADPERLRILLALFPGPLNVSDLSKQLGEDIVKVSHHLGVLRNAGVVHVRREGRFSFYSLHPDVSLNTGGEKPAIELGCCRIDLSEQEARG